MSAGAAVATGGTTPTGIEVEPSGQYVHVVNSGDDKLSTFVINSSTGALTQVGMPTASGHSPLRISVEPFGHFAYVTHVGDDTVAAFVIDNATGILSPRGVPVRAGAGLTR
mgnify:CR=1 FL=1